MIPLPTSIFFLSVTVTALLLRYILHYLKRWFLDQPNSRSSHIHPTPRAGGSSFVFVISIASAIGLLFHPDCFIFYHVLALLPLSLIGLLDDFKGVSAIVRYCIQLFTALFLVLYSSFFYNSIYSPFHDSPLNLLLLLVILIFIITAIINFSNFMDGLDGLFAGSMLVAFCTYALNNSDQWFSWVVVGALSGFLYYNWSPAVVFMGDTGSTYLGALYSILALSSSSLIDFIGLLLVITPLLADPLICIIFRLGSSQNIFKPHKQHLYQRLQQSGLSHHVVACIYMLATAFLGLLFLFTNLLFLSLGSVFVIIVGLYLNRYYAIPYSFSKSRPTT